MDKHQMKELCLKHINRYVLVQFNDGSMVDGIVEQVDDEHVYLAVPVGDADAGMDYRQPWGYPGYGYPGSGYPDTVIPASGSVIPTVIFPAAVFAA